MSKKLTLDQFIERSNKTHNFKYDYSKSIFKSRLDKLLIGCKVHGFFEQRASDHLSGRGCAACAGKKKLTKEDFVRRANSIFKNYYDYSNSVFTKTSEKITIKCPKHGEFFQLASNHLAGKGCIKCTKDKASIKYMHSQESVILRFNEIHKGFYDYSLVDYKGCKNKVKIICPEHGVFEQEANAHMVGKGCNKCSRQTLNYKRSSYIERCNKNHNGKSNFYLLEMTEKSGIKFYKVGITTQKLKYRYRTKDMPYTYKVIKNIYGCAESVFNTELKIKKMLYELRYVPKMKFGGSRYECFSQITENAMMIVNELELESVKTNWKA